mgnify:CR=1 FL=1
MQKLYFKEKTHEHVQGGRGQAAVRNAVQPQVFLGQALPRGHEAGLHQLQDQPVQAQPLRDAQQPQVCPQH